MIIPPMFIWNKFNIGIEREFRHPLPKKLLGTPRTLSRAHRFWASGWAVLTGLGPDSPYNPHTH
jgi:hypothetical protein